MNKTFPAIAAPGADRRAGDRRLRQQQRQQQLAAPAAPTDRAANRRPKHQRRDAAEGGADSRSARASGSARCSVDSKGLTLYDFQKDQNGESACYGACAQGWPPLTTEGEPQAGEGAMASKLGTTERKDGTTQVTYAGWPLYTFVEDKKPGEDNGNDSKSFGAQWYPLHPTAKRPAH